MKLGLWVGGLTVAATMAGCFGAPFGPTGGGGSTSSTVSAGGMGGASSASTTASVSVGTTMSTTSGMVVCPQGQMPCNGVCADTTMDKQNCGACGHACSAEENCKGSTCQCTTAGKTDDCSGVCTNTLTDAENCGKCGNGCTLPNDNCVGGVCLCAGGTKRDCGGHCSDVLFDPLHCGKCDIQCSPTQACGGGQCQCRPGFTMCGTECVDLVHDPNHCGACTTKCDNGTSKCGPSAVPGMPSACVSDCPLTAMTDCNGRCYADLNSAQLDCGSCGHACATNQVCASGACHDYALAPGSCTNNPCPANTVCCPSGNASAVICVAGMTCPG